MSLINQMLKDLEQRRQPDRPQRASVAAVPGGTGKSSRRRGWLGVIAVTLLAGGGAAGWWLWSAKSVAVESASVTAGQPAVTVELPPVEVAVQSVTPQLEPEPVLPAVAPAVPYQLLTAQLSEQRQQLRLVLEFDRRIEYQLPQQTARQLRLQFPAIQRRLALPTVTGTLLDEPLHWQDSEAGAELSLLTQEAVDWQIFVLPADDRYGWRLVVQAAAVPAETPVVPTPPAPPAASPEVDREVAPVVAAELEKSVAVKRPVDVAARRQELLRQQLAAARRRGDAAETAAVLEQLLQLDPAQAVLRHELVSLRVAQQQWPQALALAEQGAQHHPDQLEWVTLQARLLAERGDVDQALSRLAERQAPSLAVMPEYYALQAHLLQKSGDFERSAQIYQALCRTFPQQGQWWIGWAVSEAQRGDRTAAIRYFEQALTAPGLSPALQQYATAQLGRLTESR